MSADTVSLAEASMQADPTPTPTPAPTGEPAAPESEWPRYAVIALVALCILLLVVALWRRHRAPLVPAPAATGGAPPSELGRRMAAAGWRLYTLPSCGHCHAQLRDLGGSYPLLVQCERHSACPSITAYPTWLSPSGARIVGHYPPEQLVRMARV